MTSILPCSIFFTLAWASLVDPPGSVYLLLVVFFSLMRLSSIRFLSLNFSRAGRASRVAPRPPAPLEGLGLMISM